MTPGLGRTPLIAAAAAVVAGLVAVAVTQRTHAAPALSPVETMVIENEIDQKIALYELLADGDAESPADIHALADSTLAPNVITDVYMADGKRVSHTTTAAEVIAATPTKPADRPVGGRHFLLASYFDSVSPTVAKVRTSSLYMDVTKNPGPGCEKLGPDGCGGKVTHAVTFVYHDTWTKTDKGWRKTESILRRDN
jgi:hypothetical protein